MLTENQKIMREIHNEPLDVTRCLDGAAILKEFQDKDFIDSKTLTLIWQCARLAKTCFGEGLIAEEHEKDGDEYDDPEISQLLNLLIRAFLTVSKNYDSTTSTSAVELIALEVQAVFREEELIDMSLDQVYSVLAGLIDCETLAPWVLVDVLK